TNYGDKGNFINSMTVYDDKLWTSTLVKSELGSTYSSILMSCDSSGNCITHEEETFGPSIVYPPEQ
ncbi:MAG: hypothetical protein KJ949_00985, partial [Nanoarchaeota archaeon]|nr:hypothetical protein [Nanoarchaeota archaeon]